MDASFVERMSEISAKLKQIQRENNDLKARIIKSISNTHKPNPNLLNLPQSDDSKDSEELENSEDSEELENSEDSEEKEDSEENQDSDDHGDFDDSEERYCWDCCGRR